MNCKKNEKKSYLYSPGFDYTYDTYYNCHNGSDCCDNDYCRCGVIQNAESTVDLNEYVLGTVKDELDRFFLERILTLNQFYDPDLFDVASCRGYYGEEIEGIYFDNQHELDQDLYAIKEMSTQKKVEYILNREYDYILPACENKEWVVEPVEKKHLAFMQVEHQKKVPIIERYKDHPFVAGIVMKDGEKYRVIDGYHRLKVAKDTCKVLVGRDA